MTLREKILSMRMNEFGFKKVSYFGQPDKDVFPNKIDIVKWVETEPRKVFSLNEGKYIMSTQYCYVIAQLEWDSHEGAWDFKSIGTRYLEDGNDELSKWILDFCEKYYVDEYEELAEVTK